MDRVRFGRALGYGARHAAKSLSKAAEAATAPNPRAAAGRPVQTAEPAQAAPVAKAVQTPQNSPAAQTAAQGRPIAGEGGGQAMGAAGRATGYGAGNIAGQTARVAGQADGRATTQEAARMGQAGEPRRVAERLAQTRASVRQGKSQAGQFRRHMWSPVAKFSSVVGLQVSGTFFALLASFLSEGLWKDRGLLRLGLGSVAAEKYVLHAIAFVLFAYFAVSNFVRAHLKQRRGRT